MAQQDKVTFEESLRKLEKLVGEMESGELPLDEMMKRFEEGRALVAACTAELEVVRQRIEKVVSAPNEPPRVEPLEIL
ncbi:MAG: exodeoxyribonuclease VII small subunit [Kiritimatiellia bacterium]